MARRFVILIAALLMACGTLRVNASEVATIRKKDSSSCSVGPRYLSHWFASASDLFIPPMQQDAELLRDANIGAAVFESTDEACNGATTKDGSCW